MLPFKDISYAQGLWNMDTDSDPIVAMKASGFYTGSKLPYLDDQLVRNYADAIRLNKVPILYHFAGGGDPATEAAYFIAAIHPLAEGDVYALDWEIEHPDPVGWVNTFVTKVHDATGVWPLVYMDIDRCNRFDWASVFDHCGLWLAAPSYGWDQNAPVNRVYVAQQGPIVNGVDTDMWFNSDINSIKAYAYRKPVPPPPAPEPTPTPPAPVSSPSSSTSLSPSSSPSPSEAPPIISGGSPPSLWQVIINWLRELFGL